jgi:hypothetical protein
MTPPGGKVSQQTPYINVGPPLRVKVRLAIMLARTASLVAAVTPY